MPEISAMRTRSASDRARHFAHDRAANAVRMTLAKMLSADQVPVKSAHSMMHCHEWVVLIAGSTGSALRAVALPTFPSRRMPDAISSRRKCTGETLTLILSHQG